MENFEIVIFFMTILIALSAIADKIKLPSPIILVIVGLIVGFVPFLPDLGLNPEIVFLVFLPPILFDAATRTSWHDFKREIKPISTLAISLVLFTTVAVAITTYYLIPGFTWALAFVLGAIVSPPDAVAATSIIKGLGLNRKVVTIIEGESLVNDASALIAYRYAVAAVVSGTFFFWEALAEFFWIAIGGIIIGYAFGYLMVFAHGKIKNNAIVDTSLSLLSPYIAYLFAERFHMSGVLAVVSAGLYISWRSREVFSSHARLRTTVVWETIIFLLNGIIFILIGLQMPALVKDLSVGSLTRLIGYGLIISVVTVIIRILWVFAGAYLSNLLSFKNKDKPEGAEQVSWKNVMIVAWTGTRGVVSLATALALPLAISYDHPFPFRHSILLLAFVVIIVTLVVQGLTLPLLIRLLKIPMETKAEIVEESEMQIMLSRQILHYIDNGFPISLDEKVYRQIRKQYELILTLYSQGVRPTKQQKTENENRNSYIGQVLSAQLLVLKYERELLLEYHKEGTYPEEIIQKAERLLDFEELRLEALVQKGKENKFETTEVSAPIPLV